MGLKDSHGHYTGPCAECGQERALYALHMCRACYEHAHAATKTGTCAQCGRTMHLVAKHLCYTCYSKKRGYTKPHHEGTCADCGRHMRLESRHLCRTCYGKAPDPYGICRQCHKPGQLPYARKTTCATCHMRDTLATNINKTNKEEEA